MPINYYLQPNPFTPDSNNHSARVLCHEVYDQDRVIEEMLLSGTTITRADATAVFDEFYSVIERAVANGHTVNLPIVNFKAGVGGVFDGKADFFERGRHKKSVNVRAGVRIKKAVENAEMVKVFRPVVQPILIEYTDYNSNNSIDSILTAGGIGQVIGKKLKFDPGNPEEGIFFIASDGATTKVTVL